MTETDRAFVAEMAALKPENHGCGCGVVVMMDPQDRDRLLALVEQGTTPKLDSLFGLQREIASMAERGVWCGKPPTPEQRTYDDGFMSAMAHVADELLKRLNALRALQPTAPADPQAETPGVNR